MKSYIIEGGKKLEGTVKISGSKNASLPILAATILSEKTNKLYNVPQIKDTKTTLEILKLLGCKIKQNSGKIEINSKHITKTEIPEHLMREMRSTVIMAGALLGRFKEVTFSYPGGCDIGSRPIDLHINAFKKLGVEITEEAGFIKCKANKIIGTNIDLDFPSVGATENIILATVLSTGTTTINNAAMEPEIIDMVQFLKKMGAKIQGEGTNQIIIDGVEKLSGVSYNIMPDRIEAGSYLLLGLAHPTSKITLTNVESKYLEEVLTVIRKMGGLINIKNQSIELISPTKLKAIDVVIDIYPSFPTDLQQILTVVCTKAEETSTITDNIYVGRFSQVKELKKAGCTIDTLDNKIVINPTNLSGTTLEAQDLRCGFACIVIGSIANNVTVIEKSENIFRGYEKILTKLRMLKNLYLRKI